MDAPPPAAPALPRRLLSGPAGRALTILTAVNLLNYLDRFLVPALVESLRADLSLRDAQVGALTTAFILVYMVASPAFGALGDRRARPPLLALGVALWSGATALSALARGFAGLVVARAAVGIGEAAYGTLTPGLLADHYEESRRGRAYAVFFMAIPVGAALGYVVGGLVDRLAGWRAAFLVAGLPGIFLALACLRLADPPRGAHDHGAAPAGTLRDTYLRLLRNGPYALTVLGYAAYTFAVGGLAAWMPAFLERVRGVPRSQATAGFGLVVVATGLAGTLAGGAIADALRRRWRAADLWVSGIATLAAVPFAVAALAWTAPGAVFAALVLSQLLLFASTGPVNAAIVAQVEPRDRASAVALSILAIHALGDVPSPTLVGWLSDRSSLGEAVKVLPAAVLVAGVVWTWAARREERRARTAQAGSIR